MNLCFKSFKYSFIEHIVVLFIVNTKRVCRAGMIKPTEITKVRYRPYATIEKTNFLNTLVLDNFVEIENYLMRILIWHTTHMLNISFKFMYLLMRLLVLPPAQHMLPLY